MGYDMDYALNRELSICAASGSPFGVHIIRVVDMPAHIKNALLGSSCSIPITKGKLNLGIWQGIYLCEHRNRGGSRRIVATVQGESRSGC